MSSTALMQDTPSDIRLSCVLARFNYSFLVCVFPPSFLRVHLLYPIIILYAYGPTQPEFWLSPG